MVSKVGRVECRRCGNVKPISEFDKQAKAGPLELWNIRRRCKECIHAEYLSRRAKPKRRKAMERSSREWKRKNPERHAALNQEYRARCPERVVAQNRLNYAIRKGLVVRQPCENCGTTDRVHGHHASYAPEDWYNVNWLCYVCHKIAHSEIGENYELRPGRQRPT